MLLSVVPPSLDRPLDQSVSVSDRPVLPSRSQRTVSAVFGEPFSITASVRGVPQPEISWSHNGEVISPTERVSTTTTTVGDRTVSTLTVSTAESDDAGMYAVQVNGDSGSTSDSVDVSVQGTSIIVVASLRCTFGLFGL